MWYADGKRKSKVVGFTKEMTKGEAREEVARIVADERATGETNRAERFGEFVEKVYFPYYSRKWKDLTWENKVNRISVHLVAAFRGREIARCV